MSSNAMSSIVECSPNFSEGRREAVVEAITASIAAAGAHVLDVQIDAEQNRSGVRFVGDVATVERAALAAAATAVAQIDLTRHSGTHPRIGAVDVIPFAPVSGATIADCVALAERVGRALAEAHDVPVYLYGEAAKTPERRDIGRVRAGEYEGLREAIAADPARQPDFGPPRLGPAGAVAVGARHLAVRGLVHLRPRDPDLATAVAGALDRASGGLAQVEARPIEGDDGFPAVAVTILAADTTPLPRVAAVARAEAEVRGGRVTGIDILGFVPLAAVTAAAAWQLQLQDFRPDQIIETHLASAPPAAPAAGLPLPREFVAAVAADTATPGGGSVAALAAALGAALCRMVAGLTLGKPRHTAVEAEMTALRSRAEALQAALLDLVAVDSAAFEAVMDAYRLPRATADDAALRRDAIQAALRRATEVPLEIMRAAVDVLDLVRVAVAHGNPNAISDAGVAGFMALAAAQSASLNVDINVIGLRDIEEGDGYRRANAERMREARQLAEEVERLVRTRMSGNP